MPTHTRSPRNQDQNVDRDVGVQLQSLRIFAGMTIDQASTGLRVSAASLLQIEQGTERPAPEILLAMATLYDVPPSRIFAVVRAMDIQ